MTAMENYNYNNIHMFFSHIPTPWNKVDTKIPFLLLSFLHKKVFLLYVFKLTRKRRPLSWGVRVVNENLTNRICRCWEAGAHLEPATFWSELLITLDATCSSMRHMDPANCTGAAQPGLLKGWQASLSRRLSCPCGQQGKARSKVSVI